MRIEQIKADLKHRMSRVGKIVGEEIYLTFMKYIAIFYGEFSPKLYTRTSALQGSLASPTSSGGFPVVNIEDHFNEAHYSPTPIAPHIFPDGTINAMNLVGGTHGNADGGTAIYTEGNAIIASQVKSWVIAALGF